MRRALGAPLFGEGFVGSTPTSGSFRVPGLADQP